VADAMISENPTVWKELHPNGEIGHKRIPIRIFARVSLVATRAHLVDIILRDAGRDQSGGGKEETTRDALDGRKLEAHLPETEIYEHIHN